MNYEEYINKYHICKNTYYLLKDNAVFPEFTVELPPNLVFGFPPCFVPFFSDDGWPGYTGTIVDIFGNIGERYYEFYSEEFQLAEVARNLNQFKTWLVFYFYFTVPEIYEVEVFSESIDFSSIGEVEKIFSDIRSKSELKKLSVFSNNLPLVLDKNNSLDGSPKWKNSDATIDEIYELIEKGKLERAWYALNSKIFDKTDMFKALQNISNQLVDKKERFDDLIMCWKDAHQLI